MQLDTWLLFSGAALALSMAPGPNNLLAMFNGARHGVASAAIGGAGRLLAFALMIVVTAMGLGVVLAASETAFMIIKWGGAIYLVYLGLREWRQVFAAQADPVTQIAADQKPKGVFWHGFIVAITNPKTLFFFVAFFPQFIDPLKPAGPQLAILCTTFMVLAFLLDGMYAVIAGRARAWLAGGAKARLRHGITGTLLLGTGLGLALARRG